MNFHEVILTKLLAYRKRNPNFKFTLRQRNVKDRLDNGIWFQGTENYAFVGLINASGGSNRTRSVGLVFHNTGEKNLKFNLEVVYNDETNPELIKAYDKIVEKIDGFEELHKQKYIKRIGATGADFRNTFKFLDEYYELIMSAFNKTTLTKHILSEEKFLKSLEYINKYRASQKTEFVSSVAKNNQPTNLILYGPPGTGKTYRLKNELFDKYTTRETSVSPEQHFEDVAADLSWWQVTALALLELKEAKVAEIKQNQWVQHKVGHSASKNLNATIWGTLQTHALEESQTVSYKQRQPPLIFDKSDGSRWRILEDQVKEQAPELLEILDSVNNFKPDPDKSIERYVFTTFHQSYSYEDFLEGIKPVMEDESDGNIAYRIEPGIFKKLCDRAAKDPDHRYAIFIDEINRGNIANIFGELITLIEPDKRTGGDNPMSATLPYSKTKFSVPSNVDIYGTMNTADRSVEALDTALRRRFSFREMMPQPELIDDKLGDKATWNGISLSEVLKTINDRIEVLVDRDHAIGHSYFLCLQDEENFDEALKAVFTDKIIPLLQEYFYNDYVKIGMVLGEGFVKTNKVEVQFANFAETLAGDYTNDGRTELIPAGEIDLEVALKKLLNISDEKEEKDATEA